LHRVDAHIQLTGTPVNIHVILLQQIYGLALVSDVIILGRRSTGIIDAGNALKENIRYLPDNFFHYRGIRTKGDYYFKISRYFFSISFF
jgi:hypothetical protein